MLKKVLKWTFITLAIGLVAVQFIRPERNISPEANSNDILAAYGAPGNISQILHKACYDCHSNNTNYPWYTIIQPVGLWMADHVDEGKEELNFSEFATFKTKRKLHKLKEVVEQVEEGEMPLSSYTWMHKEAILTPQEKQELIDWAKGLAQTISIKESTAQK